MTFNFFAKGITIILFATHLGCKSDPVTVDVKFESDSSAQNLVTDFQIKAAGPTMPTVRFSFTLPPGAEYLGAEYRNTSIRYAENGRNDVSQTYSGSFLPGSAGIDFRGDILGGNLSGEARVKLKIRTQDRYSEWVTTQATFISGENPTKLMQHTEISDINAEVLAYNLSGFTMFENGHPLNKGGYGIFQIPLNSPAGMLWNWRLNCDEGKRILTQNRVKAQNYPEELRVAEPDKYSNLPNFTQSQILLEAWQLQRGEHYFKPEKYGTSWTWTKLSSQLTLADSCLTTLTNVQSGTLPDGWND